MHYRLCRKNAYLVCPKTSDPIQCSMRKPLRFRQLLAFIAFMASILVNAQAVGINATGAAPDPNAVLDLNVSGFIAKRGLMIPRMTEAQRIALFAPLPAKPEDNGLLVYQTDTGAVNDPANQRGFWYYSAVAPVGWIHLSSGKTGWSTTGNTVGNITGANAEFVGTANLSPNRNLLFRTVLAPANPAMQMGWELFDYKSGFLGLGTAAPATERVEVEGAIHLAKNAPVSISPPLEGTIRYGTINGAASSNTNLNWHWGTSDTTGTRPKFATRHSQPDVVGM